MTRSHRIDKAELDRRMCLPPRMTPEEHAAAAAVAIASMLWGYRIDVVNTGERVGETSLIGLGGPPSRPD
jgi:hypothetical protein